MDRFRTFLSETAADGGGGDLGGDTEADAGGEVVAGETAADETAAAEEAAVWAGPSQEEWQAAQEALGQFGQHAGVLEQLGQMLNQEPDAELPEFDPFEPDSFQKAVDARVAQVLDERLGPIESLADQQIHDQGEKMIAEHLEKLQGELGEFDHAAASLVAQGLLGEVGEPVQALKQGAELVQKIEKAAGEKAVAAYKEQLANIGRAPSETGGDSAAIDTAAPPLNEVEAAKRFMERQRLASV